MDIDVMKNTPEHEAKHRGYKRVSGSLQRPRARAQAVTWTIRDGRAVWSNRTLAEWLEQLTTEIVDAIGPEAIRLFGSLARGDDNADSDIDLLIVLSTGDLWAITTLQRSAREAVTAPVPYDLSFTTTQRFTQRSRIAGTIERAAARDGRLLYERT